MSNSSYGMLLGEVERDQRQRLLALADDLELADALDVLGQRGRVLPHDLHDPAVAGLAETHEVVVLGEDHRGAGGEVEREGRVRLPQVVLVEDQVLSEIRLLAEDQPADSGIDESELVAGGVDRPYLLQPEVPLRVRIEKRPDEGAAGAVDVEGDVEALLVLQLDQEVVDPHHVVGVAREGGADHRRDADRVLVDVRLDVLRADRVLTRLEGHDPRLHVEVAAELLPDHVHVPAEDQIRGVRGLAGRLTALAPLPLQRECSEHDRLRRALRARPRGLAGRMEELGQHPDAALLDLEGLGVLGVVDEVAMEVVVDHPPRLRLHPGGDEGGQVALGNPLHRQLLPDQAHRGDGRHRLLRDDVVGGALGYPGALHLDDIPCEAHSDPPHLGPTI